MKNCSYLLKEITRPDERGVIYGKSALFERLESVLRLFKQGLSLLGTGQQPTKSALAELAAISDAPIRTLGSRLRQVAHLNPWNRNGVGMPWGADDLDLIYLSREDFFAKRCLLLLDKALDAAMNVVRDLLSQQNWPLAEALVKWVTALHPQLGAVAALEVSARMRCSGLFHASQRTCRKFLRSGCRDNLSGMLRQLLSREAETAETAMTRSPEGQMRHSYYLLQDIGHPIKCLSPDGEGRLFTGGFTEDLVHGGLSIVDPVTGETTLLHDDMAVSGLNFDSKSGMLFAISLRSRECDTPHLAVIDPSGRVEHTVNLCEEIGKSVLPCCIRKGPRGLLFRDAAGKAVYELSTRRFQLSRTFDDAPVRQTFNYGVQGEDLLLFSMGQTGYKQYNTDSREIVDIEAGGMKNIYTLVHDNETGANFVLSIVFAFGGNDSFRSRIAELARFEIDGTVSFRHPVYSGVCSDMTLSRYDGMDRIYLAADNGIIGLTL